MARAIDSPSEVLPTPGGPTSTIVVPSPRRAGALVEPGPVPSTSPSGAIRVASEARSLRSLRTASHSVIRSLASLSPVVSASRIERASSTSRRSLDATDQGISNTTSSQLRIHDCSGFCSLIRSRRSASFRAALATAAGRFAASIRSRYESASSSVPSPSSFRIAANC